MLSATTNTGFEVTGLIDNDIDSLTIFLTTCYFSVKEIKADGDELVKCCEILGRQLPKSGSYTFLGNNAQEIAKNWDSN